MWALMTLIAVLVCLLTRHFLNQLWAHRNYPPGPLQLPIIGGTWWILMNFSQDALIKLAKRYGNIYTIWAGNFPVVVLSGFEAMKEGVINHSEYFDERPMSPFIKVLTNGKGIMFSNGHTWKQHRKFSLVTMRKLGLGKKGIEYQIQEEASQLVDAFANTKGQPFDPTLHLTNSVTNVICLLNFGRLFSVGDEDFLKLKNALLQFLQFTASVSHILYEAFPWLMKHLPGPHKKLLETRDQILSFVSKEIEKHRVHQSLHEPQDFIDYYLLEAMKSEGDPNSTYNEENIIESIMDLFAAGTETTTTTLLWGLLLMTNYPDIQGKVQKEIDDILGSSQPFSYHDRKKLPYTNAVIHEIQRYQYILFFGVSRKCSKEVNLFDFFIPKGATVVIDIRSVLFDPKQWKTPHMFNPNHFLDQHGHFVEREAFIPFGAGARVCPGEQLARIELFIFFVRLLRTFTFQPPEGVKKIKEKLVIQMTSPPYPYKVCAIPRSNA